MITLRLPHILTICAMTILVGCNGGGESSISSDYIEGSIKTLSLKTPSNNYKVNSSTPVSFTLEGDCSESGESLSVLVDGDLKDSVDCIGGQLSFVFDTNWLNEGDNLVDVVYGSNEKASENIFKDTVIPVLSLNPLLNISSVNSQSYSFSGTCSEDGSISGTVGSISVSDDCLNGTFSIGPIDVSSLGQGPVNLSLVIKDNADNESVAATSVVQLDTVAPTLIFNTISNINTLNVSSYSLSGDCSEEGIAVSVKVGVVLTTTPCSGGEFSVSGFDVAGAAESLSLEILISQEDSFGNKTEFTSDVVKDTVIPTVGIDTPSMISQISESFYTISGTCSENGRPVSGMVDVVPFSTTCSSGQWIHTGIDVSFLADGTYSITASTSDTLGNNSNVESETAVKNTSISLPSITFLSPVSGFGNNNSVTIQVGSISNGFNIKVFSDNNCTNEILSENSTGNTHDMSFANNSEGVYEYYFKITDLVPNTTDCLGPKVYTEDQTPPVAPNSVSMSSPLDGETSNDSTPLFSGTISAAEEGATVRVFRDLGCLEKIGEGSVSSGSFSVLGNLAVDGSHNGLNQFFLKVDDKAGNSSSCFDSGLSFTLSGGGLASLPKLAMVGNNSPSQLVSLESGNRITWTRRQDPQNPIDLGIVNAGQVIDIEDPSNTSIKVDYGDKIESTKACYVVTQGYGTAPWASEAYAGKKFTTYQYRYGNKNPKVYVAAIGKTAFVQILQDKNNDGSLDVVDYMNIPGGSVHEFTVTLLDNKPWQVVSTENVNVYYVSKSSGNSYTRDARVLTPAAKDVIGFSSYITSVENTTTVDAYRNDNNYKKTQTINVNQSVDVGRMAKSSMHRWATRAIADKPISMLQIADGDGVNASPSLPVSMMATHYGISRAADYIGIIAIDPATTITVTAPDGTDKGTFSLARHASAKALAPYTYKYTDGASVAAGTRI